MTDKKPKGAKTAYNFFNMSYREEMKTEESFAVVSKECAAKWKIMSEKEKQKYVDMAIKDKSRFNKEMEDYEPSENTKSKKDGKKNKRKAKDPNEPKRPWSAFFFFCDEFRNQIRTENPEFKVGDVAKVLGKMWAELSDKSKYEEMNTKAKAKYAEDMEKYQTGAPVSKKSKAVVESDEEEQEESVEDSE